MSVEMLVLVALFIVLPLIQQVIRATRQRNEPVSEQAERQSSGMLAPTPPSEPAVPPLPATTTHSASDARTAAGDQPAADRGARVGLAPRADRNTGQSTAMGLRTRRDLRSAIVLMAMLGPCRATNPHDWPGRAGTPEPRP
jgi:hypothetical protein